MESRVDGEWAGLEIEYPIDLPILPNEPIVIDLLDTKDNTIDL